MWENNGEIASVFAGLGTQELFQRLRKSRSTISHFVLCNLWFIGYFIV